MADKLRELTPDECAEVCGGWGTGTGVLTAVENGGIQQPFALTIVFTLTLANGVGLGTRTAPTQP